MDLTKAVVIDTNAYSAFKLGRQDAVGVVKAAETIVFTPTVLGELLGGFSLGKRGQQNEEELQQFLDHPKVIFLTINAKTAEEYARIYQELKAKGRPIPTNDMWIAAMARQLEMAVFRGCLGFGVSRPNAGFLGSDKEIFREIRESQIPSIGSILRKNDADRAQKDQFGPIRKNPNSL